MSVQSGGMEVASRGMSEVQGLLVAHGGVAAALVDAVERISGVRGGLVPISNVDCSPQTLRDRIRGARTPGPTVVFVDMASGSCTFASLSLARESRDVAVVTGVNLPMLLDFLFHRDMELSALAQRLVEKGRSSTSAHVPTAVSHADRPVQD